MCDLCSVVHTFKTEKKALYHFYVELVTPRVKYMNEPKHVPTQWRHIEIYVYK